MTAPRDTSSEDAPVPHKASGWPPTTTRTGSSETVTEVVVPRELEGTTEKIRVNSDNHAPADQRAADSPAPEWMSASSSPTQKVPPDSHPSAGEARAGAASRPPSRLYPAPQEPPMTSGSASPNPRSIRRPWWEEGNPQEKFRPTQQHRPAQQRPGPAPAQDLDFATAHTAHFVSEWSAPLKPPPLSEKPHTPVVRTAGPPAVVEQLATWATDWLSTFSHGGPHGPGSQKTIRITNDTFSYLLSPEAIESALRDLHNAFAAGTERESGRSAVMYEGPWNGQDALWIEAIQLNCGGPPAHVTLVQTINKGFMARAKTAADGIEYATFRTGHRPEPEDARAPTDSPRTRTANTRSLRVLFDAACMLIFGICLIAGSSTMDSSGAGIVGGIAVIAYAAYIAFSASFYFMHSAVYLVVIFAVVWVCNGGSLH